MDSVTLVGWFVQYANRFKVISPKSLKDKIIESAIVNWFEDEDAGIEKVWNYFRAI